MGILAYSPFYLIFKSTIFLNTPFWSINAWAILILFLFFINQKILNKKWVYYSSIDLLMHLILFYFIWLIFQAAIFGSTIADILKRAWQHLIPLLFYFISYRVFDFQMLKKIETVTIIISSIISTLFILEWIFVNMLGMPSFYWSIAIADQQQGMDFYTSRNSGTGLTDIFLKRIGGPLGTYHMTSLFIAFGLVFSMNKIIYTFKKSKIFLLLYCINLIAFIMTFSRTVLIAYLIATFFCYFVLNPKMKKLFINFNFSTIIILSISISFFIGEKIYNLIKIFLFDKVVIDIFIKRTSALDTILENAYIYFKYIAVNPILFFTGTGLGYFGNAFSILGSDFGLVTIHNLIGTFGFLFFGILYFKLKKQSQVIIKLPLNIEIKSIIISSFTCITISILSFLHYSPLFHIGNYLMFYLFIAIISNSVKYNISKSYYTL